MEDLKGSITAYKMGTQFSMVTHWNTVNMASPMLSKEVMPEMVIISDYKFIYFRYDSHLHWVQATSQGRPRRLYHKGSHPKGRHWGSQGNKESPRHPLLPPRLKVRNVQY